MVAHAILLLKTAMGSGRKQVAGNDVDKSRSKTGSSTSAEPAYSLWGTVSMVAEAVLPQKLTNSSHKEVISENIDSSKPTAASLEPARRGSNTPAPADIDKIVALLPQMYAELQYSFRDARQRDEVAALLVTPGYTSCGFVGSTNDVLLGAAIIDTVANHICYVLAFGIPGRAVCETVVKMLNPGKITLHDGTNEENKHFWPDLGFEMNTNRTTNPEQSPKELIATQDVVLKKINAKWSHSTKKRWVEGTDFRVLRFELTKNDVRALHRKIFGCYARTAAVGTDKLKNQWLSKSSRYSAYWQG
jgi:hypothetical protein